MKIDIKQNELGIFKDIIARGTGNKPKRKYVQHEYQYEYQKLLFNIGSRLIERIEAEEKDNG